jgi:hypothetical protein
MNMITLNGSEFKNDYKTSVKRHEAQLKRSMKALSDRCIEFSDYAILIDEIKKEVKIRLALMFVDGVNIEDAEYKEQEKEFAALFDKFNATMNQAKKDITAVTDRQYASC